MAIASVGYGVSAILLNLMEMVFLLLGSSITDTMQANLYYSISAGILLVAGLLYFIERNNSFVQFYMGDSTSEITNSKAEVWLVFKEGFPMLF